MAYAATVTVKQVGPGEYLVRVSETDCGAADEAVITGLPVVGRVRRMTCQLIGGTAVSVDPVLAMVAAGTGVDAIVGPGTPAAIVTSLSANTYATPTGDSVFYHRSQPNAGADNVIETVYNVSGRW